MTYQYDIRALGDLMAGFLSPKKQSVEIRIQAKLDDDDRHVHFRVRRNLSLGIVSPPWCATIDSAIHYATDRNSLWRTLEDKKCGK